ncbi:hypothetical protein K1T71_005097 [Dendrolimus kikuchii]|uniref:Uncharacterized protein n=1 Tax=Dendrolimus kikuchii TaxID=765133 RepID=A0ACC1D6A4_9NEOP|nr:hypothetical protein K1T71_005097 [Dendrolimus kikuchii]
MARIDFRVLFVVVSFVALEVSAAGNATEASTVSSTSSSTSSSISTSVTTTTTISRPGFIQHITQALTSIPKGMAIACENSAKALQDILGSWMPFESKLS